MKIDDIVLWLVAVAGGLVALGYLAAIVAGVVVSGGILLPVLAAALAVGAVFVVVIRQRLASREDDYYDRIER